MAMPTDLILVRHGESEGNVARRLSEKGDNSLFTEEFCRRHSSRLRLTDRGRRQADAAGEWIRLNISPNFERYLVSGYDRAMETAARLQLPEAKWYQDFYLRERDMGLFDIISEEEKKTRFEEYYRQYKSDPFYWAPPNGESVAAMCIRIDRVLHTLHRECAGKRVIIVCHGMVMLGFMVRIERLTPQMYLERQLQVPKQRIRNCQVMHYSRRNPVNGMISDRLEWIRSVCPWDVKSEDLAWRPIMRPSFSNEDLMRMAEESPRYVS